jgi:hypothetical protein
MITVPHEIRKAKRDRGLLVVSFRYQRPALLAAGALMNHHHEIGANDMDISIKALLIINIWWAVLLTAIDGSTTSVRVV